MLGYGRAKRFTATGDVATGEVVIQGMTISPGTAATTVVLREGGAAGAIVGSWTGPANGAGFAIALAFAIQSPHLTITGVAAEVTVVL